MSAEGVFSFCQVALLGCLSFAGDPSVSYILSHIISSFRLINQIPRLLTETISQEVTNLKSKRALWLEDGGTGNSF